MTNLTSRFTSARRLCAALLASAAVLSVSAAETAESKPAEIKAEAPQASRFAIGAEAGTTGYGPVVVVTANKYFTANLGYTWFNYDYDFSNSDGDYTGKLKLSNFQVIANYHPFAGTFHLSAGAFVSNNKVDVTAKPKAGNTYQIGDVTYSAAQVGVVNGTVELTKGVVPFVGLGWSKNPVKKGFGVFFDMGVLFMDSPKAKLSASGPISGDPVFQANLRKEEGKVNDELDGFKYYPVVQGGLIYRF